MRRNLLIAGALALAAITGAGCSGCTQLTNLAPPVKAALSPAQAVCGFTLADEKGLLLAQAAMIGADTAAGKAVDSGALLSGSPLAVKIADGLDGAHKSLVVARAAYAACDAKSYGDKLRGVNDLIAETYKLLPKTPVGG